GTAAVRGARGADGLRAPGGLGHAPHGQLRAVRLGAGPCAGATPAGGRRGPAGPGQPDIHPRARQAAPNGARGAGRGGAGGGTAGEVEALAALVPGTTKLLGSAASEQELDRLRKAGALKRYRLLHFATHGEVQEADPDRSRLVLAQDRLPDPRKLALGRRAYS